MAGATTRPGWRWTVALLAFGSAACGGVAASEEPAQGTAEPLVASTPPDGDMRIVPVDGDLAEVVFALGLGDSVVATDISATFPDAADAMPEIGYQRALAAEPIIEFEPTIILATDLAGPAETIDDLERLGVEVAIIPRRSDAVGPGEKIRAVANILGVPDAGEELAASVDADIASAIERARSATATPKVGVLYIRGENVQLLLGEGGGVDWMIDAAGGIDVADELGVVDNAPINAEALVEVAPAVLIVPEAASSQSADSTDCCACPGSPRRRRDVMVGCSSTTTSISSATAHAPERSSTN